jgi:hypothetical protein
VIIRILAVCKTKALEGTEVRGTATFKLNLSKHIEIFCLVKKIREIRRDAQNFET